MQMPTQGRPIGDYLQAVDPMRGQMAKSYAVVPGGPMNNDPGNALSFNSAPNVYQGAYRDIEFQNAPQLAAVMPAPVSQKPQQMVTGQVWNQNTEFIQQPDPRMSEMMAGERLGNEAMQRGLNASAMGPIGQSVDMGMILPGGVNPQTPSQAPNTMPMNTMPPEMAALQNSMMGLNQSMPPEVVQQRTMNSTRMNRGARMRGGMTT